MEKNKTVYSIGQILTYAHDVEMHRVLSDTPEVIKKGDTIQCADEDDAINTMTDLVKKGVETDFLYEKDGIQGLWLEVKEITENKKEVL